MVDARGTPLTVRSTAANVNEVTQAIDLVAALPAVAGRRGRPRHRLGKLHADRAYRSRAFIAYLRQRGITPRIARYGEESKTHLGRHH